MTFFGDNALIICNHSSEKKLLSQRHFLLKNIKKILFHQIFHVKFTIKVIVWPRNSQKRHGYFQKETKH